VKRLGGEGNLLDCGLRRGWVSKLAMTTADNRLVQVTYFKKRRVMEYQRNQTLEKLKAEGATEMPGQIGPGGPGQKP
jgi:hypothetical protein